MSRLALLAFLVAPYLPPGAWASAAEAPPNPWFEAGRAALERARSLHPGAQRAKNLILFVGDGMGVSTVTAARILEGQLRGESGEENLLSFERFPYVALLKTYNTNLQVPDSAGSMTAIMSGVKTKAAVLGVDERVRVGDHRSVAESRVETLLERAEARGLSTGVVTTTSVTHATPAACYAHVADRRWADDSELPEAARRDGFPDIARQLIEFGHGDGPEVVLGGGRRHFLPTGASDPEHPERRGARVDGRDLTREWTSRQPNSTFVWNLAQFEAIDPAATDHLLGLFEPSHLAFEADRGEDRAGEPSLAAMTAKAIEILARNPKGFFLMVEGGRIDHGHHYGNAYRALTETLEFARSISAALARIREDETLVIVTADHSHVLTMSGYPVRGNPILGLVRSLDRTTGTPAEGPSRDGLGLPYTTLSYANGPGYAGASDAQPAGSKRFPHRPARWKGAAPRRPDLAEEDTRDPRYLQDAGVPLSMETHAGEDVAVYATGPGASLFHGVQEQSYVYHAMAAALGW